MKSLLTGALCLCASSLAVGAQELPSYYNWSGLYLGGHVGYMSGEFAGALTYDDPAFPGIKGSDIFSPHTGSVDAEGFIGGGQIGFNVQHGRLVWGIVADISGTDVSETASFTTKDGNTTWNIGADIDYVGTVRGKIGLATGSLFLYGTGGFAYAGISANNAVSCVGCPIDPWATGASDKVHTGWVVGGGGEVKLAPRLSLGVEYLYVDLGNEQHTFVGTAHSGTVPVGGGMFDYRSDGIDMDYDFQTVRVLLNYQLYGNEPVGVPLK